MTTNEVLSGGQAEARSIRATGYQRIKYGILELWRNAWAIVKLLLSKAEIERLQTVSEQKGATVIPLQVRVGRYIKILLGVGKGKKKHDKRQRIKERDVQKRLKKGQEY